MLQWGGGFTPIFMKLPKVGFEKAVAQQSSTLGIRTKFDGNRPINRSNINIFEQDQLNMKGKPKLMFSVIYILILVEM